MYLHKSTDANLYSLTVGDKDLLQKLRKNLVRGPSIVFMRKAVVDKTFIRKFTNLCKSIVSIDASQLYTISLCQPMPIGVYTRWLFDTEIDRFTPRQNKSPSLEIWSCPISNARDFIVKLKVFSQQVDGQKLIAPVLMGFVLIPTVSLKLWDAFHHY